MALERKILTIRRPTIAIDEMSMVDTDSPNAPLRTGDEKTINQAGAMVPLIEINKYKFTANEIMSLRISETGFLPEISFTMASVDGVFQSKNFPKDGDPISVFIASKKKEFKPIRADFDIRFVNSSISTSSDGERSIITFDGVLRVPGLYAEHCVSFQQKTSFDTLVDVSSRLQLGFASNEQMTSDRMTWLCPFDTYERFIKDVAAASYKDDDSFFKVFVDKYYILNMVNVNNQFSEEFEVDRAVEKMNENKDYYRGHPNQMFDAPLYLTNHRNAKGLGAFISGYSLQNNAGQVVMDNGYRRFVQFYDASLQVAPEKKYQAHFVEPLTTEGADGKILLRGRPGEGNIYATTNKYKWLGLQFGGRMRNCHDNYLYAVVQNWQNNQEIEKLNLVVQLEQCNFNIYRGMRLPVLMINEGNVLRQKITKDPGQPESDAMSYDRFLSGYYFVSGIKYMWSGESQSFSQELILTRREWPIPVQNENLAIGNAENIPPN